MEVKIENRAPSDCKFILVLEKYLYLKKKVDPSDLFHPLKILKFFSSKNPKNVHWTEKEFWKNQNTFLKQIFMHHTR